MSKISSYVCAYDKGAEDNLITVCTASGVKLAGMHYGVFYGTSEIFIAL
jgi:hypothetical protein